MSSGGLVLAAITSGIAGMSYVKAVSSRKPVPQGENRESLYLRQGFHPEAHNPWFE